MSRNRRILVLLLLFVLIAGITFWERLWVRGGTRPLAVAIYPVALDDTSAGFVAQLRPEHFQSIGDFIVREGRRWKRGSFPAPQLELKAPLAVPPPLARPASALEAIRYTLSLRWYAFRQTPFWNSLGTIRLFVLYHEPKFNEPLPHSLGLKKGLLGVVHVFASGEQQAQNNVVIAHELLHTLGATDKYDGNGLPVWPAGYADTYLEPRWPQLKAEIMAGRIPITASQAEIPASLDDTLIGPITASEVGW